MSKVKIYFLMFLGVAIALQVSSCKRRPGAGAGEDGVSPIAGIHGDSIYGEELGPRFGMDGAYLEGQFEPVLFAFDSSQVESAERAKLDVVANHLRRNPGENLIVEGHTDERGSREYNLSLGERRALAARAYLIGLGIDGGRIQTRSYGQERPAEFGHNEEAWRQNRRAEFVITQ